MGKHGISQFGENTEFFCEGFFIKRLWEQRQRATVFYYQCFKCAITM